MAALQRLSDGPLWTKAIIKSGLEPSNLLTSDTATPQNPSLNIDLLPLGLHSFVQTCTGTQQEQKDVIEHARPPPSH